MYVVSADGCIRLSFAELQAVPLVHLSSGLDEPFAGGESGECSRSAITGHTEWVSQGESPKISLSWDWEMVGSSGETGLRRVGAPYSNVRIVDARCRDLEYEKSQLLQELCVDALDWQQTVLKEIGLRYR